MNTSGGTERTVVRRELGTVHRLRRHSAGQRMREPLRYQLHRNRFTLTPRTIPEDEGQTGSPDHAVSPLVPSAWACAQLGAGVGERTPGFRTNRSDPPESCQHKARRVKKSTTAIKRRGVRRNELTVRKGETRLAIRGINLGGREGGSVR